LKYRKNHKKRLSVKNGVLVCQPYDKKAKLTSINLEFFFSHYAIPNSTKIKTPLDLKYESAFEATTAQ
jgi:hypothetical protein